MENNHRVVDRGILSHIYYINFQLLAVLGSRGFREKKDQTAITMLLLRAVFSVFMGTNIVASTLKSCISIFHNIWGHFSKIFVWLKIGYLWNESTYLGLLLATTMKITLREYCEEDM